ncbi:MAG: ubiquinone biosynthesis protein [Cycloclasticus pugetii]|uniref:Probable protein kinase UbiB n=2 Tax=Cycloclasticus TaxID=34067 RepID=S5T4G3_9GAMM|nr:MULTISPECIES: ubiquinone biosynthesis regulatory protein kinase UbiB [Cycloclasticus]AGS38706.1 Ubiquinone biosynthesis monooxygenase UbiB [Cycloclasticus zancles 78-ME]ATI02373.1 ubiquinone biosynthesis regulatory protein kinase UbiB [Cycloclasticus sp. PY97N]EPD12462.1 Ubiquinone biosynthesis monooxygenase UbiB [Cycloclasticus pugetii]MBV1899443.1 ubiquinone biosynthesis regulatory protein kinase UbiB [Cycloclasticus sp.]MDF1829141.1 ubiquinone biosynthesis regulatory protein kinase UbiB 
MINPTTAFRLIRIQRVLLRYGLDEFVFNLHLFRPLRYLTYLSPSYFLGKRKGSRGERLRKALEDLGPIFVKFGQILSTRQDLLPPDIGEELSRLQDNVPPFADDLARQIIESSLEVPIEEVFSTFSPSPLASASVAQVHTATLHTGEDVVVKVLRPGIEKIINSDVGLLYTLAELANKYWGEAKRLKPLDVVKEFDHTIHDELDLVREAANASQLRRNFEHSEHLYVPDVYWDYTRQNVMVMERIYGTPIGKIDQLREKGVDLKLLAERGVEIFFAQVFRDNFFHADMHPGNIFASDDAKYLAVDFGIMGSVTLEDQRYLAENFLAFFQRDYLRVAQLHIESGWVPKETRVDEFESAIRAVCEPIFEKPLKEISYGHLLLRLFQTARRFDMEVQPQLVLLQKTLLNIEGLGRQLYPDLDLWQTAKPYLEEWYKNKVGPKATFNKLKEHLPMMGEKLPELPEMMYQVLSDASKGELEVKWRSAQLEEIKQQMAKNHRKSIMAICGGSLLISAAVILGLDGFSPLMLGDAPLTTWVLGVLGGILLFNALD